MIILEYFGFISKKFFFFFFRAWHNSNRFWILFTGPPGEGGGFHFKFMNHSYFWQCQFFRKFFTLCDIDIQKVFPFLITATILQPVTLPQPRIWKDWKLYRTFFPLESYGLNIIIKDMLYVSVWGIKRVGGVSSWPKEYYAILHGIKSSTIALLITVT